MKKLLLFAAAFVAVLQGFAQTNPELRKSHWTVLGGLTQTFDTGDWEHLQNGLGGTIAISWSHRYPITGVFLNYQLAAGIWDCSADAMIVNVNAAAPRKMQAKKKYYSDRTTEYDIRPSVAIGYQWLFNNGMALDFYGGGEYQFGFGTVESNTDCPNDNDGLFLKAGLNLHINKRWMANVEFAPGLMKNKRLNGCTQRLQFCAGYKF